MNKKWYIFLMIITSILYGSIETRGNPWTIKQNEIYISSSFFSLQSHHRFNLNSKKQPFSNNGSTKIYGLFFNTTYGITDKLNLNAVIPVMGYDFRDDFNRITGSSLGDVNTALKYKIYDKTIAAAVQLGVKFPSPNGSGGAADIRIGEGHYDYNIITSIGYKPSDIFTYMNLDLGFRYRKKSSNEITSPGNEFFFRIDNGIMVRKDLLLSTGIEGFSGGRIEEFGIKFPDTERRLFSFSANLVKGITPKTGIILNMNVPFAGKNYNAGSMIGIGFFFYRGKYINIDKKINLPSVTCQTLCQI